MKIKDGLVLNKIADEYVVVSHNPDIFNGILKINDTGAFIFELLQKGKENNDIIQLMTEAYYVTRDKAENDLNEFIQKLDDVGMIEK